VVGTARCAVRAAQSGAIDAGSTNEARHFRPLNAGGDAAARRPYPETEGLPDSLPPIDWLLWQLADSALPTGGFAHSGGLEAAYQHGEVRNRNDLREFIEAALHQCSRAAIPFVAAAFDALEPFRSIDGLCDAFTTNHIANRASRLQGRALLNSAERSFSNATLTELQRTVRESESPAHFAPICGAIFAALGVGRLPAMRLFLFNQLRGWTSSAVRLGIVGPIEAQGIQAGLASKAERFLLAAAELALYEATQTAPILELFQASQDRLYSRLFQS
jgi:urease accessory protein